MKTIRHLAILTAVSAIAAFAASAQDATDQEILRAIDEARFLETESVSETMQIVAIRPGEPDQEAAIRISYNTIDDELFRLRLDYLAPEENAGQSFLILEDESVLLCTPGLEFPLVISGGTSVFGDSTVSTTAGIHFEGDYEIVSRAVDTREAVERLRLEVRGIVDGLAYPTAMLWIDPNSYLPLEIELYALSGDPLNRIRYDEYAELDGDRYLVSQTIETLLFDDFSTVLTITEISTEPHAEGLLDRDAFCQQQAP